MTTLTKEVFVMNLDKYNSPKETKPPLTSWKDSVAVTQLSEYMRMNKDAGIKLCIAYDGRPCIDFNHGTRNMELINRCQKLLEDAADDLKELIDHKLLKLPHRRTI